MVNDHDSLVSQLHSDLHDNLNTIGALERSHKEQATLIAALKDDVRNMR